jgi:hypothetical protein
MAVAISVTSRIIFAGMYCGASFGLKSCGPIIFPTENAPEISALAATLNFVNYIRERGYAQTKASSAPLRLSSDVGGGKTENKEQRNGFLHGSTCGL